MKVPCVALSVVLALGSTTTVYSQTANHLVPVVELEAALSAKAVEREAHLTEIRTLLRHEGVREHLSSLVDLKRMETAIATLDDATLQELGSQSRQINAEIAASGATKWILIVAASLIGAFFAFVIVFSDK